MDQSQNLRKRRHIVQMTSNKKNCPMMVDQSTMTEYQRPMNLNVWTQTESDTSIIVVENELKKRVKVLEDRLRTLELLICELTSCRDVNTNNNNNEKNESNTSSYKYKIVSAEGTDIQLEPIIVEYGADEDVIYYEEAIKEPDTKVNDEEHSKTQSYNHSQNVKQEIYSNSKSKTYIPTSTASSTVENPSRHTATSTVTSDSLPSMFNNIRPVPETLHQLQPSNSINDFANDQLTRGCGSNSCCNRIEQQQVNELIDEIPNKTSNMKIKSNNRGSPNSTSNVRTSNEFKTPQPDLIGIGPNNTLVPLHIYESIDWSSTASATRKLLTAVFDRSTLATHSLTGKPSPAFHGRQKPSKKQLNPNFITDIVFTVSRNCKVAEREVRSAITTKCADENKMLRLRERKMQNELNKENIVKN